MTAPMIVYVCLRFTSTTIYAYDKASNIRAVSPQFLTSAMAIEITIYFIRIQQDILRTTIFFTSSKCYTSLNPLLLDFDSL